MIEILSTHTLRVDHTGSGLRLYIYKPGCDIAVEIPASFSELLDLADRMQDAACLLRAIVSESDPGRVFEANQALQFGAQKLEGDL